MNVRSRFLLFFGLAVSLLLGLQISLGVVTPAAAGVEATGRVSNALPVLDDFESGLPSGQDEHGNNIGIVTWGGENPTLESVSVSAGDELALPGQTMTNTVLQISYDVTSFGGFTHAFENAAVDQWVSQDWSSYEGLSFWLYGANSSGTIQVEIFDNRNPDLTGDSAERFFYHVTDDFTGWQHFSIPFTDFQRRTDWQPGGAPDDGFGLTEVWGYAFGMPGGVGSRINYLDDVELVNRETIIIDFESELPSGQDANDNDIGIYIWGDTPGNVMLDRPMVAEGDPLALPGQVGSNSILSATYDIGGWGGFTHAFANEAGDTWVSQDWSTYEGFSFWLYGSNSGGRIQVEIFDNRNPDVAGDSAERWVYYIDDTFMGWQQFNIPFSDLVRRTDWQPGGAPDDGLGLTEMWGYAFGFPSGVGRYTNYLDDVKIYGRAGAVEIKVELAESLLSVAEGDTATLNVTLNQSTTVPVSVDYATSDGSAMAGSDYTATMGTLDFAPGESTKSIMVATIDDGDTELNETLSVMLSNATNATIDDNSSAMITIVDDELMPYEDPSLPTADRVNDLLGRMTLEEKIGQMTQVEKNSLGSGGADITTYHLGSVLSGGGGAPSSGNEPVDWADMYDSYQELALSTRLGIPLIYGVDAVHGHSNVYSATIFPHNIGLGATRNPELVQEIGRLTAIEVAATGLDWNFSPCLCVARDDRWGRTYESFGEDPEIATMMTSIITGYQGTDLSDRDTVLATAKHWVGDGGTTDGIDQGDTEVTEEELRAIHIAPFEAAIEAGVGSIMPSYSSWNGEKLHGHTYLISDVLKSELGFEGFIISDWAAIDQIPGDYNSDVRESVNAGVDMIMQPYSANQFTTALNEEVAAGNVSMARIDDAVTRILTAKFELGLFEAPYADRTNLDLVGAPAHRDVARQAVRESLVLLKNADNTLPLAKDAGNILVAGRNADDIGHQSGGWTISWQGSSGDTTPGTTILEGIQATVDAGTNVTHIQAPSSQDVAGYDVGVVVVGETPYAEGAGYDSELVLTEADAMTVETVCGAMPCVVVLVSGRPMIVNDQLAQSDAFVAAWLPGTEGDGVAEVLFGDYDFTGKLPMSWARSVDQHPINVGDADYDPLFAYGYGLTHDNGSPELSVSFAMPDYKVPEGEMMSVTVRLNQVATQDVMVDYATADGSATADDYTSASGTLTFPAGTTVQSFTVETLADENSEQEETVNLTLSNATNAALGDRSQATVTIQETEVALPDLNLVIIDDFEAPISPAQDEHGNDIGHYTWGDTPGNVQLMNTEVSDSDPLALPNQSGNNMVLQMDSNIGSWGGFTHAFAEDGAWVSQDWSSHVGFSFWFYGASSGGSVQVEIFDNRNPDQTDDSAERFVYYFDDDFTGWKFFNIPFGDFQRRTDWQPGGAPDDGLGLTEMWGYAFGLPAGNHTHYLDNVALVERSPIIDDFEGGLPAGWQVFGDTPGNVTTEATVVAAGGEMALPGQEGENSILSVSYDIGAWGGFSHDFSETEDWSNYAGFSFWFYGTNSGNTIQAELFDNGADPLNAERFDYDFVDNFMGWRHINIPFAWFTRATDFNPDSAPDDGFTLTEMWGYAIVLPAASGTFYMDDVALIRQYEMLDDFESGVPEYYVTWGNAENNVTLTTTVVTSDSLLAVPFQEASNTILQADYDIPGGGWGGFTSSYWEIGESRDWRAYEGLSFWLYGNNTGVVVRVEIQDNLSPDLPGDTAERYVYDDIIDDYTGWKQISIPFSAFQRRTDWQPGGAPDDGLGLDQVSGYAITFPPNVGAHVAYMDDVRAYGKPPATTTMPELMVGFDNTAIQVHEGDTATITVTLNMTSSLPVTVTYSAFNDTAMAGSDYGMLGDEMPMSGTLVFEANSMSQSFTVATIDDTADEMNETVSLRLSHAMNAALGASQATLTIQDDDEVGEDMADDFEHVVWSEYDAPNNVTLVTTNVMSGTDMAVPGQDMVNSVLHVSYDIPMGESAGFTRTFQVSQDWSGMAGVNFWFHGSNSGETMTVEIQDNGAADPGPSGWTLAWSDEFDGAAGSAPDPTKWTAEVGDGTATGNVGWGNAERQYYTDSTDNAALDGNGNLVITARALDTSTNSPSHSIGRGGRGVRADMECYYGPCEYTSARLITENKAEFAYGRVEARLKIPFGQGLWPAFWMLGGNFRDVGWPDSGEIDIMENVGFEPNHTHGALHGPGYSGNTPMTGTYTDTNPISDDFHVFTIEWEPEAIRWYVDGNEFYSATPADLPDGTEWVYDHPFFLLLNVAVGGYWPGYPDDSSVFPQTMEVDYVRVYQAADTAERFEATFTNDFTGWQEVSIPFTSFTRSASQPAGAPDDDLTLTEVWGYGLKLTANSRNTAQSSGTFMVDQVQIAAADPTNVFMTQFGPQATTSQPLGELAALLLAISAGLLLWRRRKNA